MRAINHMLSGCTSSSVTFGKSRPEDATPGDCRVAILEKDEVAVSFEK
jgi:hypothetical protein